MTVACNGFDAMAAAAQDPAASSVGFDQRVYAAVARIPAGQLATYGQIAELIGAWGCARQVGWALRRLPLPSAIPWHRVVNAAGRIAMTPSREGSDWIQRELLIAEGIPVDLEGRLPLARFRWRPPHPWEEGRSWENGCPGEERPAEASPLS
jgi:methylated-DNA-protein-cysteine methyltransferase-like protein